MNKSKINLIFSGRDAFPRTISESLCAGCYNVALSTLSDGKNVLKDIFGKVIYLADTNMIIRKSGSLSYKNNNKLWFYLVNLSYNIIDHKSISIKYNSIITSEIK